MKLNFTFLKSAMAVAIVAGLTNFVQADVVLWDDPDPANAADTVQNVGIVTNPIADPTGTGSAIVGEVDLSGAGQWSSLGSVGAPHAVTTEMQDQDFTLSFDYYVPTATTLGGDAPTIYAQFGIPGNDNALNNYGTFGLSGADRDVWIPFSFTGNMGSVELGNPATINPLIVLQSDTAPASGAALYIDNINFTVETAAVPEPTSLGLIGLGVAGLAVRRRRR